MTENTYHIVGHQLCPYVQRVVILMDEKLIPHTRTDIDLKNKPDWLLKISPTQKVPVLVVNDDKVLFESHVICEYLDEVTDDSLYPQSTFDKANHRSWISFGSEILDLIAKVIYRDTSLASSKASLEAISERFELIEQQLGDATYFSSSQFYLIDAVYATIFRYFTVFQRFIEGDPLVKFAKVKKWRLALEQRESVKNAVPINYNDLLVEFIKDKDSYIGQM